MRAAELVEKTTAALARFDAAAVGELERQALRLAALPLAGTELAETQARMRVFASVLRETDRGLRTLRRVRGEGDLWAR